MRISKIVAAAAALVSTALAAAVDEAALAKAHLMLEAMTLDEKATLCASVDEWRLNAIERAGIAKEWQMAEPEPGAQFLPSPAALASTWSVELAGIYGTVLGMEARAKGKDMVFSPAVNIIRTPLCGRNIEYFSEDPVLTAKMAAAEIRAMQKCAVAACVKHFALASQEDGRDEFDAVVNDRAFNEIYLPAFRAAVKDAAVAAVATSCNLYNGVRCAEHPYLLRGILRERWGFDGMIVSGLGAQKSCIAAALAGAGVERAKAGSQRYFAPAATGGADAHNPLAEAVRDGDVPERVVNEKVIRILYIMARTGFFGDESSREKGESQTEKHQKAALRIAEEAITLLKNDAQTLPLNPKAMTKILLVGRLADAPARPSQQDSAGAEAQDATNATATASAYTESTPYKGLVEYFKVRGQNVALEKVPLVAADLAPFAHDIEGVEAWDAEWFDYSTDVQEVPSRKTRVEKPGFGGADGANGANGADGGESLPVMFCVRFSAHIKASETGDYVFACDVGEGGTAKVTLDGETIATAAEPGRAVGQAKMESGREYQLAVVYSAPRKAPHSLALKWRTPSELPSADEIKSKAESADAIIVFTGTEIGHGRAKEGPGADRPDLRLAEGHDEAIERILGWGLTNKLVVVNRSAAPVEMPWATNCPAILHLPYLGYETGRAVSRVIFGDVNPSGKLPVTWPKRLADTAVAAKGTMSKSHSIYNEGLYTGYRWNDREKIAPLFPFGHGLSYTKFEYDMDKAEVIKHSDGAGWSVSVPVKNTGTLAGREVAQIYAAYPDAKEERPVKELKGFAKTRLLSPGESETLTVSITPRDLAYWDVFTSRFRLAAGTYELLLGSSASDIRGRAKLNVAKEVIFAD